MGRVEDIYPIVLRYAARFARATHTNPEDCAHDAMVRVIKTLNAMPNVANAYLWKVIRGQCCRTSFEDSVVPVPGGTEDAKRAMVTTLPTSLAVSDDEIITDLPRESQMIVDGYSKREICRILNLTWTELHRRLRVQWSERA